MIGVRPSCQRRGVGTAMIQHMENKIKALPDASKDSQRMTVGTDSQDTRHSCFCSASITTKRYVIRVHGRDTFRSEYIYYEHDTEHWRWMWYVSAAKAVNRNNEVP